MYVVFLFSSFSYQKIHKIDKNNTFDNEVIW